MDSRIDEMNIEKCENTIDGFDWGVNSEETISIVGSEIFENRIYEQFAFVKDYKVLSWVNIYGHMSHFFHPMNTINCCPPIFLIFDSGLIGEIGQSINIIFKALYV